MTMQPYLLLSHFLKTLKENHVKININQLLAIIKQYKINNSYVKFHPVFSFTPENQLINDVIIIEGEINVYINIYKIPIFNNKLITYYSVAEKNEQHKVMDIIVRFYAKYMHHYFYGLNINLDDMYGPHETISNSASILCQSLRIQLSDFVCYFDIMEDTFLSDKQLNPPIIGKKCILNFSHIAGPSVVKKATIKIHIMFETFNENMIERVKQTILNNHFLKTKPQGIAIKVYFIAKNNHHSGHLKHLQIGKSTLNTYREITLSI